MAVKAQGQITLSSVVDVQATYRYYLLQSSTLTKPAKPASFPPDSTWDDVEPTYTDGSTNSLYFVDCTVFCDDTFSYSEVSLSSSYEAAKTAYNKAVNAQDTADNAQNTANNAQDTANSVGDRVEITEAEIQMLTDSIAMLVTDGNGGSLMTQTEDGWTFNIGDIVDKLNAAAEDVNSLGEDVNNANHTIDQIQQNLDDMGVKMEYIVLTSYNDQPCIELGETDSDFKLRITNTEIQFADGTTIPAYISNKKLYIERAEVKQELQQGGFVWTVRANGNLGLQWKGVST